MLTLLRRLRFGASAGSRLTDLIPPEIQDDRLAAWLRQIAMLPHVRTILEIGASSGEGSTSALAVGALLNPAGPPVIHAFEISGPRHAALCERFSQLAFVHCHRRSSVTLERFARVDELAAFCARRSILRRRPTYTTMVRWRDQDVRYVEREGLSSNGIRDLKATERVIAFDAVLIDGSEFTAVAELEDVYGTRYIVLDDVRAFKNYANHQRLLADPAYVLLETSPLRNGFSVFARVTPAD